MYLHFNAYVIYLSRTSLLDFFFFSLNGWKLASEESCFSGICRQRKYDRNVGRNIGTLTKKHSLFSSSFICATVSNASCRAKFCENVCNTWVFIICLVDSLSIFLTINPCIPCLITCANFSESGYFSTRFISETESVAPIYSFFYFCLK